jgi:hypothetical protein
MEIENVSSILDAMSGGGHRTALVIQNPFLVMPFKVSLTSHSKKFTGRWTMSDPDDYHFLTFEDMKAFLLKEENCDILGITFSTIGKSNGKRFSRDSLRLLMQV